VQSRPLTPSVARIRQLWEGDRSTRWGARPGFARSAAAGLHAHVCPPRKKGGIPLCGGRLQRPVRGRLRAAKARIVPGTRSKPAPRAGVNVFAWPPLQSARATVDRGIHERIEQYQYVRIAMESFWVKNSLSRCAIALKPTSQMRPATPPYTAAPAWPPPARVASCAGCPRSRRRC
jgi:hypothetical protein